MIPLSAPNIRGNEVKYVTKAIADGWVSTGGSAIDEFENEFARYSGAKSVAACQSGTAALHLALADAGVGAGDMAAAPALTFIATVNPIRYVGAEPVFMDCDDSLCVDPDKLENYLHNECELRADGLSYDKSAGKPVKALVVAHIFGNSADMERLCEICQKYNLILIEDAAEAVGTFITSGKFAGKMLGTIGDYGAFSFNGNKIITTGGGGIVTSSSPERTLHMRHLAAQAKTDGVYYLHDEIGYNYRMTNVQAAIGLAQLELLEEFIKIKHTNYNLYVQYGADLLPFRDGQRPNYWFYSYLCPPARSGDRCVSQFREITYFRDGLIRRLKDNGIQTRPVWGLCCEQPMYRKCRAYMIERAPEYGARIVNLPCGTNLAAGDVRLVMDEIKTFCADYGETNATSG